MKRLFLENRPAILTVSLALVLAIGWFTIPKIIITAVQTNNAIKKNYPAIKLPQDIREKIEKDVRDVTMAIKTGDKRGSANFSNDYISLGVDFETLGLFGFAEDAYRRAIKEDPANYVGYANLGGLHQTRSEYSSAIAELRNAIERAPTQEGLYVRLSELYWYRLGDLDSARGIYLEGIMRTNNNDGLVRSFASFLEQTNQKQEAIEYFDALVKRNPGDQELKKHLDGLKGSK